MVANTATWDELGWTRFLKDYWQQQPLLLPQAMKQLPERTPEEWAGMGLETDVESRLIWQQDGGYRLRHGPFRPADFSSLSPTQPWTLLIQSVDCWWDDFTTLREQFFKLPAWRVDDVMVSLACRDGGVGPHTDDYDVFLIQARGTREWQITQQEVAEPKFRGDCATKVLTDFHPHHVWTLNPGDMLYLPPGYGHNGVAKTDDCITYSIGFRAPTAAELVGHLDLAGGQLSSDRFRDPGRPSTDHPFELLSEDVLRLQKLVEGSAATLSVTELGMAFTNPAPSTPQFAGEPQMTATLLLERLEGGHHLRRSGASRILYAWDKANTETLLFCQGQVYGVKGDCRETLGQLLGNPLMETRTVVTAITEHQQLTQWCVERIRYGDFFWADFP